MMTSPKPSQSLTTVQPMRPLPEQDRIDAALRQMAIRLDRVLTEPIINQWHNDLCRVPIAGIEYAADWCGRNLKRWPKLSEFFEAVNAWMGQCEQSAGPAVPSREEIARRRDEFQAWYRDPEAAPFRAMVAELDKKMLAGRPRLYTQEELERFRRKK